MIEDSVLMLLKGIGEDPTREGLLNTPRRVAKAWAETLNGRQIEAELRDGGLTTFESPATRGEMVLVRDIRFESYCEHHLMPFIGKATVGYAPRDRVIGLSKIPRIVDAFARRLQLQEKLTQEIGYFLMAYGDAEGVGVIIEAEHQCMTCRGVRKTGASMRTQWLDGTFRHNHVVRSEFLMAVNSGRL